VETKIGLLALGSHEERHGTVLPPDTDAKIASHIALEAAKRTGARFLGVLHSSYELPDIDTGRHQTLEQLIAELRALLFSAKKTLGIRGVVLVNGHGGNDVLREHLQELEEEVGLRLIFNNKIVELEGPHAATGEVSIGAAIGIADSSKLAEHVNFERHPEVGFVGLKSARKRYAWAEQHAKQVRKQGVRIDKSLGKELIERAISKVIDDVGKLSKT
jgi:2-amino-5-formylamino-6-ribosylaminopyrimidin-4(3H)-one 5'-monophosphate deformylase